MPISHVPPRASCSPLAKTPWPRSSTGSVTSSCIHRIRGHRSDPTTKTIGRSNFTRLLEFKNVRRSWNKSCRTRSCDSLLDRLSHSHCLRNLGLNVGFVLCVGFDEFPDQVRSKLFVTNV